MGKKYGDDKDLQMRLERLSKKTQDITEKYLETKAKRSKPGYKSVIIRTFELLDNKDIADFTIEDYEFALLNFENQKTNISLIKSFFRDSLNEGLIIDRDNFIKKFYEEDVASKYNKSKSPAKKEKHKVKKEYTPTLSFEQIQKLQEFLAIDFDDLDKLKGSFICYMFFYTDCQKDELDKEIKATDYYDGKLKAPSGMEYTIPLKYEPLLNFFASREKHTGFGSMYDYLKPVEAIIGVEKLTPSVLMKARNENTLLCSNCGERYFNTSENWVSVEGRIVCQSCAEKLKKNYNYKVVPITETAIERTALVDEVEKSAYIYGYDKLKENLFKKEADYRELNKLFDYIGKLGEAYVVKKEKQKLQNTEYFDKVDETPAFNPSMGYDIKSYTENGKELYIEVKTEAKGKENDFFLSENERKVGAELTRQGKKYYVYRVHNILSKNEEDVRVEVIEDVFTNPTYKIEVNSWRISK